MGCNPELTYFAWLYKEVAYSPEAGYPFSSLLYLNTLHCHHCGDLTHVLRVIAFIRVVTHILEK